MSGSSMSANHVELLGCRIAGPANYTPAHMPAGGTKPIRQMASFTVFQNINEKTNRFKVTAFGPYADVIAKSGAPGKEIHIFCELNSYKGRVPIPNNGTGPVNFVTDQTGQPLLIEKVGLTLTKMIFGADSNKQIQQEIQTGQRPPLWNVAGHPDAVAWRDICTQRNSIVYTPGAVTFGYAKVMQPNGQIVDPKMVNNMNPVAMSPATGTAQTVVVNGQNMGFAPPQNTVPYFNGFTAPAQPAMPAMPVQPTQPVYTQAGNVISPQNGQANTVMM